MSSFKKSLVVFISNSEVGGWLVVAFNNNNRRIIGPEQVV
jgi:hypothetical protein